MASSVLNNPCFSCPIVETHYHSPSARKIVLKFLSAEKWVGLLLSFIPFYLASSCWTASFFCLHKVTNDTSKAAEDRGKPGQWAEIWPGKRQDKGTCVLHARRKLICLQKRLFRMLHKVWVTDGWSRLQDTMADVCRSLSHVLPLTVRSSSSSFHWEQEKQKHFRQHFMTTFRQNFVYSQHDLAVVALSHTDPIRSVTMLQTWFSASYR